MQILAETSTTFQAQDVLHRWTVFTISRLCRPSLPWDFGHVAFGYLESGYIDLDPERLELRTNSVHGLI